MPADPFGKDAEATQRANSNYKKLSVLVGIPAAATLMVMVPQWEGTVYKGYKDPIGIPTKCMGDTNDVVLGKAYSKAECAESLTKQLVEHSKPVMACVPNLKNAPEQWGHHGPIAASVDLAYNIGTARFCKSSAARYFRQSKWELGCQALGLYTKAGGKELKGLVRRRQAEVRLCMTGAL